jgi:uncharacterized SAM-binding protein YcdF (DUF218 family)
MTASMMRHAIESILNPFFFGFIIYILLLLWAFMRCKHPLMRIGLLIVFVCSLLFSTGFFSCFITKQLTHRYAVISHTNPAIRWIVVLGGGQERHINNRPANHVLYNASMKRLIEGVRLYRQLPHAKLLLSGGGEQEGLHGGSEAEHMGVLAEWFAIPKDDLVFETDSINTADQAVAIKHWVGNAPFYLVTSANHMPRALALCRAQGLHPIAAASDYPHDSGWHWQHNMMPNPINLVNINSTWHELLGFIWGKLRGHI